MSTSAVDGVALDHEDLDPENGGRSPLNGPIDDADNGEDAHDEASDEIDLYFRKLLERTKKSSVSSANDTTKTHVTPREKPLGKVISSRHPTTPEPRADNNAQSTQPRATDNAKVIVGTGGQQPVSSALLTNTIDVVPAVQGTPLQAIRQPTKCDISTMREVANSSAHNAIALHGSNQLKHRARVCLSITLVTVLISALIYSTAAADLTLSRMTATAILTLGLGFACRSHILFRRARHVLTQEVTPEPK